MDFSGGYRGIILDFDDTLAETRQTRSALMAESLRDLGANVQYDDVYEGWGTPFLDLINRLAPDITYEDFESHYTEKLRESRAAILEPSFAFLASLRYFGSSVVILTSGGRTLIETELEIGGIRDLVDVVLGAEDTAFHKPDGRTADEALEWFSTRGIAASQVAYVGDSLGDLLTAQSANIEFFGVLTGTSTREDFVAAGLSPNSIFPSVGDLDLLRKLVGSSKQSPSEPQPIINDGVLTEAESESGLQAEVDIAKYQREDMLLQYVSQWFIYHAQQRIQGFNFFLIIQGALLAAAIGFFGHRGDTIGLIVTTTIGVVLVIPFLAIEVRNLELVNSGRSALDKLEEEIAPREVLLPRQRDRARADLVSSLDYLGPFKTFVLNRERSGRSTSSETKRAKQTDKSRVKQPRIHKFLSHTFMLRLIYLLAELGWLTLLGLAIYRLA
jgi:phosphoglycolate phosphatase